MATYTVKQGDTLNAIANQYGYTNYKDAGLVAKSGNPDLIRPGETFSINQAATSPKSTYVAGAAASTPQTPAPEAPQTPAPEANPFSAYSEYLRKSTESSLDTPEIIAAREANNNAINASESQALASRKAYEDIIHTPGGLKSGALESGSVSNRNNSYIAANLGLVENATGRTLSARLAEQSAKQKYYQSQAELNKPTELGNNYYNPATGKIVATKPGAGFELSPGQARYDSTGKLIASQPSNPLDDAYKRKQMENLQSEIDNRANNSGKQFVFPKSARNAIMAYGFQPTTLDVMEKDIQRYGVVKALEGLDPNMSQIIQDILKTSPLAF